MWLGFARKRSSPVCRADRFVPDEGWYGASFAGEGRKPTARAKSEEVKTLLAQGMTKRAIAAELNISERSVYRVATDG
ncbi:helix-turn-helix domain-containing protein [Tropicimonas aquimaris]|uniref:Helix-turn-helix domain-containing protein n=1 Tax=Tropicimonas aquimaris TaxID=914152 RepID=A0ABW3IUJ3_9RHOB